ncbi:MAG: hypothetical protein H0U82_02015 [Actinobacteria bacterium]|nr:hypothetical protein [Actinomycetota bacterium]
MPTDKEPPVGLDELAKILESYEGPPQPRGKPTSGRQPSRPGLRRTGVVAAGALLVGSGLGFGFASSLTPSGSAGTPFAGTGFLPVRGWSVIQSGTVDANGASRAIAANVPLRPEDDLQDVPYATLESLPAGGVVIVATFTTRGDPGADFAYPVRVLPLTIAAAVPATGDRLPVPRELGQYRLQAGVGGTNVDARLYFGSAQPSSRQLAAAQRQLNRLSVASDRVTIFARPTIADTTPVTVFGSVDNGRAGEAVTIQAKDCGSDFFRVFAGAETRDGGGWSTLVYPRITTTLRAIWNDSASSQVTIRRRASVFFDKLRRGSGFRVGAGGMRSFWRKKVVIQRRQGGDWRHAKTVVLSDSLGGGTPNSGSWSQAEFTLSVPKGTLIRAVVPLSEVRPCYLSGVSRTVRT